MIITNEYNLPQSLVNAVKETHPITPGHYSVTTILKPIREIILERRHYNDIKQDVSDMVWLIFGTAVHKVLEESDKTGFAEMKLEQLIIDGYTLTGICDLYNETDMLVEDWKTASVWKVIHKDFEDWRKQGLMYAWLLRKKGYYTKKLRFHALLKDWSPTDAKYNKDYPQHPIWTWEYEISESDMVYIEDFIRNQFKLIIVCEKLPDNELPICNADERWNPGDKYAVMKKGRKTAVKVCDTLSEANNYITSADMYVETRKGEDKKCDNYCLCKEYCSYWRSKNEKK